MRVLPLLASIALLIAVADLVRRRRLREEFSWIWILGASGALVLSLSETARLGLGGILGTTGNTPTTLVAAGLLFLAGVCLDISTKVSRLANQQKNLAQDLARIGKSVEDLRRDTADEAERGRASPEGG